MNALVLVLTSLVSQPYGGVFYDAESGAGVSWPLTATGDLDMNGNDILSCGSVTLPDNATVVWGTGTDYWVDMDGTNFALTSTSVDGGGTDGDLITNVAGTGKVNFPSGSVSIAQNLELATSKYIYLNAPTNTAWIREFSGSLYLQAPAGTAGVFNSVNSVIYSALTIKDDKKLQLGDTIGGDFWLTYDEAGDDAFELWSTNIDGGGTDGLIMTSVAGTSTVSFPSGNVALESTKRLVLDGATGNNYMTSPSSSTVYIYAGGALTLNATSDALRTPNNIFLDANGPGKYISIYNQSSASNGEEIGTFVYYGLDGGSGLTQYAEMVGTEAEIAAGDEDGKLDFQLIDNGTEGVSYLKLDASDGVEAVVLGKPLVVPSYTLCQDLSSRSHPSPSAAPGTGSNTGAAGYAFDSVSDEIIYLAWEIPSCWDGSSDMILKIYGAPESGQAIDDGEGVVLDWDYREAVWGTDALDARTQQSVTYSYDNTGADSATASYVWDITIDHDAVGTVLNTGDLIYGPFYRDVSEAVDDYPHDFIVTKVEMCFQSTTPSCDHH